MNPVELDRGRNFKSLANYLLHDSEHAETSERVGWTETYNLNGADNDRSWRLMASTAMSANALKKAAGLRTSGGQNKKPVFHYTLTWPEDDPVSAEIQKLAVAESLKAIGMENHQALAVEHTNKEYQHVHVMLNLINPEDGTTPKLSYTHKKLRTWANKFEIEHELKETLGSHKNEEKRRKGEKVDARRKDRKTWEQDNREGKDRRTAWLRMQEDGLKRTLSAENREMKQLHTDEWKANRATWKDKKKALTDARDREIEDAIAEIKAQYKPEWAKTFRQNRDRMKKFEASEKNMLGRIMNTASSYMKARKQGDTRALSLLGSFQHGERRGFVEIENDERLAKTRKKLNSDIKNARTVIRREHDTRYKRHLNRYLEDCEDLKKRQAQDRQDMQGKWREYHNRRKAVHEKLTGKKYGKGQSQNRSVNQSHGRGRGRGRGYDYDLDP